MKILDKIYDPKSVEARWYKHWMDKGLFHADAKSSKPRYTIMIPPPNVTGMLTMGHILNNTIQDLLIRWKRMDGCEALWLPGTDHAGIATQNKVESALKEKNLTRHDLGREKLVEHVWEWKEKYGGIILQQLRKLGASCDWERERFTMDEGLSEAVKEVFIRLYEKDLIYRGRRLINWCPRCHTALADEEAPSHDINGYFWSIAYPVDGTDKHIIVSTTRPETMLGDSAVAVHPEDSRYAELIGTNLRLPLTSRLIPVIADEHADPEKGSGAVKITPAHDFNDFEVGKRHDLEMIKIMDDNGKMNDNAGNYKGMDRFEARNKIVEDLEALGLLRSVEPRITPIPKCYRCNTVVEPNLSDQWFVRMEPLAKPALEAVRSGRIKFHPAHWEETYFHWLENIRDWCISRQIWWGHRIPVWTCDQGHDFVSRTEPSECPECGSKQLVQDPDVLDTWFSSWLWPFSTLGWPEQTDDLKSFFPGDALVTGPDIIFFWVARMIMASLEFLDDVPFTDVYFNGMIRDLNGRKMSKSLGNSPDPLWLINGADAETVAPFAKDNPSYKQGLPAYGADAIRMTMVYLTPLGGDIHFDHTLVELGQKFTNKLWNASRFVLMNLEDAGELPSLESIEIEKLDITDQWILSRLQSVIAEVRQDMQAFRFNDSTKAMYHFIWGEFCDWYLELVKPRLFNTEQSDEKKMAQTVLYHVLENIMRLLHPLMPFITEEIWQTLTNCNSERSIINAAYPKTNKKFINHAAETQFALLRDVIGAVRNIRGEMNIPKDKKADLLVNTDADSAQLLQKSQVFLKRLAAVENLEAGPGVEKPLQAATALVGKMEIYLPLGGLIDIDVEKERLAKEIKRMEGLLIGLDKKLSNDSFIDRAPKDVVQKEREKQEEWSGRVKTLRATMQTLEK
ncbi:valine--tRNA ligase [bacterium]|nr:valine--tRNA ligase [bacterium]